MKGCLRRPFLFPGGGCGVYSEVAPGREEDGALAGEALSAGVEEFHGYHIGTCRQGRAGLILAIPGDVAGSAQKEVPGEGDSWLPREVKDQAFSQPSGEVGGTNHDQFVKEPVVIGGEGGLLEGDCGA